MLNPLINLTSHMLNSVLQNKATTTSASKNPQLAVIQKEIPSFKLKTLVAIQILINPT